MHRICRVAWIFQWTCTWRTFLTSIDRFGSSLSISSTGFLWLDVSAKVPVSKDQERRCELWVRFWKGERGGEAEHCELQ